MDLLILFGVAVALLIILITVYFLQSRQSTQEVKNAPQQRGVPVRAQEGIPRRAQIARNQRNRLRNAGGIAAAAAADQAANDSDEADNADDCENVAVTDDKMGAKKRAKLEAKAQKRVQREADLQSREEKKKKEALADEEKKREDKKLELEELKKEEAERLVREKKEREEHEEYLKMKTAFSIEEEGFEEDDETEKDNLLQEFIQYIKDNKVVVLEDLATHFKLKTQQAIDRITELQKNNTLTGVIDDRGKFIYISEDELKAVAKFVRQRGRISITELAECSNNLINLKPRISS